MISRIASSWAAIRFGVKPAWKSILSRSCLGGSMPMNIARMSSSGKPSVIAVTPPSSEEYVLPVAADGVDVLGPRDRPVAGLVGVLADPRGPVDRALVAQPGEQLVRRPVEPELALGHQHLVEIAFEGLLEVTTR